MGELKILDEVDEVEGNKILGEVGEWREVDIVEDKIKKRATTSAKGEKVKWENTLCVGRSDRQRTQSTNPCRLSAVSRGQ